jgi:hypothetical protein
MLQHHTIAELDSMDIPVYNSYLREYLNSRLLKGQGKRYIEDNFTSVSNLVSIHQDSFTNHTVIKIEEIDYNDYVYQLEIKEDFHNYFVVASDDSSEMILSKNSQMELRILAAMSKDKALLQAFYDGIDIHRFTAARVWKCKPEEVTDAQRRFSKMLSFSLVYGKTTEGMARDFLNGDIAAAEKLVNDFYGAFPDVKNFLDDRHTEVENTNMVHTIFGDSLYISPAQDLGARHRAAGNWCIQGSASSIAAYGIWLVYEECVRRNIRAIPSCFTHDSADWNIHMSDLFEFNDIVINKAVSQIRLEFNTPVAIDFEYGIHQDSMMELKELERGEDYRLFEFETSKSTFDKIIPRLEKFFEVEYKTKTSKEQLVSMEELFISKRAFSRYLGTRVTTLVGSIKLKRLNSNDIGITKEKGYIKSS